MKLLAVLLAFAVFQASVRCIPLPEKNEIIVNEQNDVQKSSSSNSVMVPNAETPESLSPENMLSDATIASLLQLLQQSLMSLSPPPEAFGGMNRISAPFTSGEVKETIIGPGAKLRVYHKTYNPPGITVLASGNIDGKNVNKVTQNQMYATENFKVLQSGSPNRREEVLLPEIVDVGPYSDTIPKDVLNDLEILETIRNEIEKLNNVF